MDESIIKFDWVDLIRSFRRWWKWYVLIVAAFTGGAIFLCMVLPPTYKASVTLLPTQSKDSRVNRLEAIASKFGIDSPVPGANFADFLEPIVGSKTFLFRLSDFPVVDAKGERKKLYDTFKYSGKSADLDSLIYLSRMRSMVDFLKKASGVIEISVTAPSEAMASDIANQTVKLINEFNQEYNYSNARANVQFLTEQMAGAETGKQRASDNVVGFLERNRGIDPTTSPSLFSKYSSLKLEQEIANQKYLLIRNQMESAQLTLNRKEPLLTVLDYASRPYYKDGPKRKQILLILIAAGFFLSVLLHAGSAILLPLIARARKDLRTRS
jgi:capsular polysaccharide biosynthesis protein